MSNLVSRTITGSSLVLLIIAGIIINEFTFFAIFATVIAIGLIEFYKLFEKSGKYPQTISGIALGVAIFTAFFLQAKGFDPLNLKTGTLLMILLILSLVAIFIYELYRKQPNPFENIALTILGVLYIAIPVSLLWLIAFRENLYKYNPHLILGFFIIIWTYDTMAYVTGMMFGKNKLFERISPKKSWEGAVGGFAFSIVAAMILSFFFLELTSLQWGFFAVIVSVFGTFGDLTESLLKRSVDIKDSGAILPGHGGILDRFDALFLAVPIVYLYLQFV